ncbi:MAG: hypothetical protein U0175_26815 [Caldilineaceae bacterium]
MITFVLFLFALWVMSAISGYRFENTSGSIERGILIWSEKLDSKVINYLAMLAEGTSATKSSRNQPGLTTSFIRKEDSLVLIRVAKTRGSFGSWTYVGVVNLKSPVFLEYRIQILALILPIALMGLGAVEFLISGFSLRVLLIPLIVMLFVLINHWTERSRIFAYLHERMQEANDPLPFSKEMKQSHQQVTPTATDRRSYIAKLRGYDQ